MPCIPCKRNKNKDKKLVLDMEDKIKKLANSGFEANRIAAMLMIHKHTVEEVLHGKIPVNTVKLVRPGEWETKQPVIEKPKSKKKKSIEDETI